MVPVMPTLEPMGNVGASALVHSQDSQTRQDVRYWVMAWGTRAMAQQVCVVLSTAEREQLAAIAADRNRPRKHIERARNARLGGSILGAAGGAKPRGQPADGVAMATTLCRDWS